ncbi:hypothetical protein DPMN_163141 [Dreissena polymorpha]|uniref:C-type lectin domain-containing protein n=1 Tax=Dreissena polymorpha TaxID=45954 RepID=A0A9D4IUX4_DREPO|nr:hypothetical protein DPMN_163141 [Dreissena polymorpha]
MKKEKMNLAVIRSSVAILGLCLAFMTLFLSQCEGRGSIYSINISCPDGFMQAVNSCYYFNTDQLLTWDQARTECSLRNADLTVIGNRDQLNWLNTQTEEYSTDGWWIGLKYMGSTFDWVQYGGDKTLIDWRNEPDDYDNQDCDAINEFGKFSDEYCRSKLGFICSYPIQPGDECPTNEQTWLFASASCFFISPLLNSSLYLNWTDAKTYCANLIPSKSTQLMALKSYDDLLSLQSLLSTYNKNVLLPWWTGLNDQQTEGEYRWVDGTLANGSLINWDLAPSADRSQHQDCGVMYQDGSIDDVTCDKRAHYICGMSAFQGYVDLGCGSWLRGGTSCYLLGKGNLVTWTDARDSCARAGAHLLKVDSFNEKAWLEGQYIGSYGFWTGLNKPQGGSSWVWQDNTQAADTYVKWNSEPNNNAGKEDCVEIHRDGLYNDLDCNAKAAFICEYPLPYGTPCVTGWFQCQQSCYYLSPANYSLTVTWFEAYQRCQDLLAGLGPDGNSLQSNRLAVNSGDEAACVNTQLQTLPVGAPGYWTDLSDLAVKGIWQYSSATDNPPDMSLINWAKEPNNVNGNESCAVIYDGGFYNDVNCVQQFYYICERTATTVSSSASVLHSSWTGAKLFVGLVMCIHTWNTHRNVSPLA